MEGENRMEECDVRLAMLCTLIIDIYIIALVIPDNNRVLLSNGVFEGNAFSTMRLTDGAWAGFFQFLLSPGRGFSSAESTQQLTKSSHTKRTLFAVRQRVRPTLCGRRCAMAEEADSLRIQSSHKPRPPQSNHPC